MLDGVGRLVRGDAECSYGWGVVNIARQTKPFACRIVMVAEKIVRLHNIDIVDLRSMQNFPRRFRPRDVGARADLAPFAERPAHPNLRPECDDQRTTDVK